MYCGMSSGSRTEGTAHNDDPSSQEAGAMVRPPPPLEEELKEEREERPKGPHWRRNFLAFWFIGMINNFFYCLVLDAADHIAESFNLKSYIALVGWANIFFGLFAKLTNTFLLTQMSYNKRMLISSIFALTGLVVTAMSPYMGTNDAFRFILALTGITCIGINSAFGESVVLGYLEGFHPKLVGAWSSGTGMSGVAAALLYILFTRVFEFSNTSTFFSMSPWIAVYAAMFFLVVKVPVRRGAGGGRSTAIASFGAVSANELETAQTFSTTAATPDTNEVDGDDDPQQRKRLINTTTTTAAASRGDTNEEEEDDDDDIEYYSSNWKHTSWGRIPDPHGDTSNTSDIGLCQKFANWKRDRLPGVKYIHKLILGNNLNLMAVYVFEYAAQFMVPFAVPCVAQKHSTKFLLQNAYLLSQLAYQVGVLCSRSSLVCIRIKRVWILSVLQFINAVGWFLQSRFLFLSSSYDGPPKDYSGSSAEASEQWKVAILLLWMFYVGLLGGAAYVNVFYNILQLKELSVPDAPPPTASPIVATTSNPADAMVARPASYVLSGGHGNEGRRGSLLAAAVGSPLSPTKAALAAQVKQDRELAMNIGAIYAVLGITLGSLLDVVFSNTILKGGSCSG